MIVFFVLLAAAVKGEFQKQKEIFERNFPGQMICTGGSITDEVRQAFLLVHNQLRSAIAEGRFTANGTLKAAAANMIELVRF